ncbi:MAG: 30S ribosomal protein S7 [Candidatus Vogelbacteria bacterium]|nr:30S ribosomal protein S7 [Candidatus Vogelbacteria bacterium]
MRRKVNYKRDLKPDLMYNSTNVEKLINYIMQEGKKNTARKVVYDAFKHVEEKLKTSPVEIFESALKNVAPQMEVRSKRIGGANYQVPHEVRPERRLALSLRWIIEAAKTKKGSPMSQRLANELVSAFNNEGEAVKKRENVHKMAEANRAFAHFAWANRG